MAFSLNDLNYEKDSKERMPWEHYLELYAKADPKEITSRLSIPYDEEDYDQNDDEIHHLKFLILFLLP